MTEPVETREIRVGKGKALGVHVRLPGEGANLLVVRADLGYVMCGYLNLELADEVGDSAVLVRGVTTLDEVMAAKVVGVTSQSRALGVLPGMPVTEALALMTADC